MHLEHIDIGNVFISQLNVRKTLTSENDEEGTTQDLANDIRENGLINPLTVRRTNDNLYEVIAGQRRFLAYKHLTAFHSDYNTVPCNVIDVNDQKAEELSLVENVQRNQMSTADKVNAYSKLYDVYGGDLNKVSSSVHLSKATIKKYIQVRNLPEEIIAKMDSNKEEKITLDVAVELAKLPASVDVSAICENITNLTSVQKVNAIKEFVQSGNTDADDIVDIAQDIVIASNKIKLAPSVPYVYDEDTDENIIIPESLYRQVIEMVKNFNISP
jgi:ParB family chromosome partitioning protein